MLCNLQKDQCSSLFLSLLVAIFLLPFIPSQRKSLDMSDEGGEEEKKQGRGEKKGGIVSTGIWLVLI